MSQSTSPLISAEELAARAGDPHMRIVDVRWVLGQPGAGRRAYESGHMPGAIFLDLDGDLAVPPGRVGQVATRCPSRPTSRRPWPEPASARTTSSSPTTTSAAGSPPGCGGCSTTSVIAAAKRCSTAGSRPGSQRRAGQHGGRPAAGRAERDRAGRPMDERHRTRRPARATWRGRPARRPRQRRATGARSSRSTPIPATSRRLSVPQPTATSPSRTARSVRRASCGPGSKACGRRPSRRPRRRRGHRS